ncbi:MAG: PQQ-binding-like beta-propeller repeat protein [bacterium]
MRSYCRLKGILFFITTAVVFTLAVAAMGTAFAQGMAESAWPCRGYNSGRTGQSPYLGAQTGTLKWRYQTADKIYSSPVIGMDGTVYIAGLDSKLYALKPESGGLLWKYQATDKIYASPAIGADGTIYVGSYDGIVHAVKPDGSKKWDSPTGYQTESSPVIGQDGTIYIGNHDGKIYALAPQDGTVLWASQTAPLYLYSSPALGPDGTIYAAGADGRLYAFRPDGSLRWNYPVSENGTPSSLVGLAVGTNNTIYIASEDGAVYALEVKGDNPILKWTFRTRDQVHSSPAIGSDGIVYIGSHDSKVYAIKPDGRLKWSYQTGGAVYSSPALGVDGTIYIGSLDGRIYALRPDSSLVWSYRTRGQIYSSPAIGADSTLYIASYDYRIYAFGAAGCRDNDQCTGDGDFCQRKIGDCTGQGVCSSSPRTPCPDVSDPVCGCDGQTYGNWCLAAANLVSIAHTGACGEQHEEVCDGQDNDLDGQVDENLTRPCDTACGAGLETCQSGQWVGCTAPQPQSEICDGNDNDCDGQVDENLTRPCDTACGAGLETCQSGQWVGCTAPQPEAEICDGKDNDCDNQTDEGLTRPCSNGQGVETCQSGQWIGCTAPQPEDEICDGKDNDLDGQTDEDLTRPCLTACGAGLETCQSGQWIGCTAPQPEDEICDGKDNDCDGQTDEGLIRLCSTACGTGTETCQSGQWVGCNAPQSEAEVCDGKDNDCDGQTDEGLTRPCGNGQGTETCQSGQWVGCNAPQPEAEICDGKDNDLDGQTDEGLTRPCSTVCGSGMETCQSGQWVGCTAPQPQNEVCDGKDNDCDGQTDEGIAMNTYYTDSDGDGYGDASSSIQACSAAPDGYVANSTDCNDADRNVHPTAPEIPCNGQDDNCQGGDSTAVCSSQGQVENETGQLDIQGTPGKAGQDILIPVRIQSAPNAVHTFGFDVIYNPESLTYTGSFEPGNLAGSFPTFDVKLLCPGRIRISGSSPAGGVLKGASGYLVRLKFRTAGGQENQGYFLQLENLGDDIGWFSATGGILSIPPQCNGDIDGDGTVTMKDAGIIFNCYLGNGTCPECADVNQDGKVSPEDVSCLTAKFFGQPSCLD